MRVWGSEILDKTVFCGALVKPGGGNRRSRLRAAPFFCPVISQGVLAEFIHFATVRGFGYGRNGRLNRDEDVRKFLAALAPLWIMQRPFDFALFCPHAEVRPFIRKLCLAKPGVYSRRLLDKTVAEIDSKDTDVMWVAQEHAVATQP